MADAELVCRCWCGGDRTDDLDGAYRVCRRCGTLIWPRAGDAASYRAVGEDEDGFYGADYWNERVPKVHGLPTLEERARTDLSERALVWLRWIASRRRPPARVLELGSAHGAFVHLLERAGYDAEGLEMSPRIVAESRQRFGITVHHGPLENADLERRFDVIAAFDVLEHLPDPVSTLRAIVDHLADGGLLFLQTPCHRGEGAGWEMLLPEEHLYLFNETSVASLLNQAGLEHHAITPGCFAYDMWIVASADPLPRMDDGVATSDAWPPLVQALLDLEAARRRLGEERDAIDVDRHAKDEVIARLQSEIATIDADRRAIDADRHAKDEVIARVSRELEEVRADQRARGEVIEKLDAINRSQDAELQRLRQALAAESASGSRAGNAAESA